MSVPFTLALYAVVGLLAALLLQGTGRLPAGMGTRVMAVLFWPAYLPVCLAAKEAHEPAPAVPELAREDALFATVLERIGRLPVDDALRRRYHDAVARIARVSTARLGDLERLVLAERRVEDLAAALKDERERSSVRDKAKELTHARARIEADIAEARESVLRLAVRLELLDAKAAGGPIAEELAAMEDELDRLLSAHDEAERLAPLSPPAVR